MPSIPFAGIKCWRQCNTWLPVFIHLSILRTLPSPLCFGVTKSKSSSHQRGSNKGSSWATLFCLTIHHVCSLMKSELCIFYLDNGTLGGVLSDVLYDIGVMKKEAGIVGLEFNPQKSEVIGINSDLIAIVQASLSGVSMADPVDATLLGSPIGDTGSITVVIDAKTTMLKCLHERFHYLTVMMPISYYITLWPSLSFCTFSECHLAISPSSLKIYMMNSVQQFVVLLIFIWLKVTLLGLN